MPKSGHAASRLASLAESDTSALDPRAIESGDWFRDPAVVHRQDFAIDQRVAEQAARRAVAVLAAPVQRQVARTHSIRSEAAARLAAPHAAAPSRAEVEPASEDAAAEADAGRSRS